MERLPLWLPVVAPEPAGRVALVGADQTCVCLSFDSR